MKTLNDGDYQTYFAIEYDLLLKLNSSPHDACTKAIFLECFQAVANMRLGALIKADDVSELVGEFKNATQKLILILEVANLTNPVSYSDAEMKIARRYQTYREVKHRCFVCHDLPPTASCYENDHVVACARCLIYNMHESDAFTCPVCGDHDRFVIGSSLARYAADGSKYMGSSVLADFEHDYEDSNPRDDSDDDAPDSDDDAPDSDDLLDAMKAKKAELEVMEARLKVKLKAELNAKNTDLTARWKMKEADLLTKIMDGELPDPDTLAELEAFRDEMVDCIRGMQELGYPVGVDPHVEDPADPSAYNEDLLVELKAKDAELKDNMIKLIGVI